MTDMILEKELAEETRVPNAVHARDVAAGKRYRMRLDGEDTTVQVMRLDRTSPPWARARRTHYVCLDERTGREIRVKSAAKFLKEVTE